MRIETITTDDDGPGRRIEGQCRQPVKENGVIRRYFPKQTEFYKVSRPLACWLSDEVRNYDVVHIHALFSYTSVAAARSARRADVPYIIRPLGLLNQYGVKNRRAILKRLSLRWIEGPLLRDAAALHFTSDAEKKEAELLKLNYKSVVIPLGMELKQQLPSFNMDPENRVLYMSRIDPKKNIESLLDAWAHVIKKRSIWKLVIAGSGSADYLASLRKRVAELKIEATVKWVGHVIGDQKCRLVRKASIFTLPSYSENFGIAAAEALMAGKACVFTPGVAVGALAGTNDAALIAEPTPASLAVALDSLMESSSRREELGMKAVDFAQTELSADVMGRRLKKLYEKIVRKEII